jgi:hypothetical protein
MKSSVIFFASPLIRSQFTNTSVYGTSTSLIEPFAMLSLRALEFLPCHSDAPTARKKAL